MYTVSGIGAYKKTAVGKLKFYSDSQKPVKRVRADAKDEKKRLKHAIKTAESELERLYEKAAAEVGQESAEIFKIHEMMLYDDDFNEAIESVIDGGINAEFAVLTASDEFRRRFLSMDSEYMRARAADVSDISERLIRILSGADETVGNVGEEAILVSEDFTPSQTLMMDKSSIIGFVTTAGSNNSHTAILARMLGIPAVVNTGKISSEFDGHIAVLDGERGVLLIDPEPEILEAAKAKQKKEAEHESELKALLGLENKTKDGRVIDVFANIGNETDIEQVLENDGGGVGLFRSEFLFLESDNYPDEEKQFNAYKSVAERLGGKKLIIRTLDIGADKKISYFDLPAEENPALGFRAIRICLKRPEIFKTQLRAIYRAAVYGNVCIMLPMIVSESEVAAAKKIASEVKEDLKREGIPFFDAPMGIMIETPAAAIISDRLAPMVDFFSIGTNDLTQYTLAADRQNSTIDFVCDTHHEAIMRLIEMTVENAHKNGIWAGICGELAADLSLTEYFLAIGIDELSVSPKFVLPLREKIRSADIGKFIERERQNTKKK